MKKLTKKDKNYKLNLKNIKFIWKRICRCNFQNWNIDNIFQENETEFINHFVLNCLCYDREKAKLYLIK